MAAVLHHKLSTVLTQDLLTVGDNISNAKCISIANVDPSSAAIINIFLNKGDDDYYLIKNYRLHFGETLFLNKDNNIAFDNSVNGFSLRIQTQSDAGTAIKVHIIITR